MAIHPVVGKTVRRGAAALGLLLSVACLAAPERPLERPLVVGSERDFPPLATGRSADAASGFTVDLWKAVAAEQGIEYTMRVQSFAELLQAFRAGKVDVLLNLARTDERRAFADFSVKHSRIGGGLFVRSGDDRIRIEEDLAGRSLLVLRADLAHDYAVSKGWGAGLVTVDSVEDGLRQLAAGRHDAMMVGELIGLATLRQHGIEGIEPLGLRPSYTQDFAFAVHRGDADLLARINEGLALTKAQGTYDRLYEKWLGIHESRLRAWADLRPWLAGAAAMLAAGGAASMLRRRRRERLAAAALQESEERWKFALEGSGDGVWDADLRSGRTLYSRRWKEMLGHAEDEISEAGDEWLRRIHPDDLARVLHENEACLEGRADGFSCEFRMRHKHGHWVWILDRGKVLERAPDGRPLRMIGTHTDISERRRIQVREAARTSAMTLIATGAGLPAVLESIVRGIDAHSDWQCSVMLANEAGTQLELGAAPHLPDDFRAAIATLPIGPGQAVCGSAAHAAHRIIVADVATDPACAPFLPAAERAGLRACWSEPILSTTGRVLGTFAAYHRQPCAPSAEDIATIADAAQIAAITIERTRAAAALRTSEERLQRAVEATRLALWELEPDTGRIYLSGAWSEMLGGPHQSSTMTIDELKALMPPDDRERAAQAMRDTLRGRTAAYAVEHRVRRRDGTEIWIASQGRVFDRAADGRVQRVVGTNRDITARKQAAEMRTQLEAQLREAQRLRAVGTLAGGIAHDFNNIVAAILGNAALAREELSEAHPARTYLDQISKAGQRARLLVQQILTFSRNQPNALQSHDLRPLVEETLALLRRTAGAGVRWTARLAEAPLHVMADITQLQQVLMNLGTNAWQALPDGTGEVELGLDHVTFNGAETDGGQVAVHHAAATPRPPGLAPGPHAHLWVRDNGIGMDDETRQHIFEPFFTTKPIGQGTGLGLAVVHGIVEAHGGAITVETAPGRGTRFDIHLPLAEPSTVPAPPAPLPPPPAPGAGQHVLYIDDDEVMVLMVQGLLQRLGYRATCLHDARAAVREVERDPTAFDLVVTDFNMPGFDGLDVARALARVRPGLPVAISSGHLSDELRAAAAGLGVCGMMQKEHTLEELGALVQSALKATSPPQAPPSRGASGL